MAVVDASFLIAAWNRDDAHHAKASKMLHGHEGPLHVNAGALAEASQVIRRRAHDLGADGDRVARRFLDAFLHLPGADIETSGARDAWHDYMKDSRLSYVDAWVVAQAKRSKQPPWSFDQAILDALR